MTEDPPEPRDDAALAVLRCLDCGDTFPTHEGDATAAECPSCGGARTEPASEPLL